jgi:hypothetical protein
VFAWFFHEDMLATVIFQTHGAYKNDIHKYEGRQAGRQAGRQETRYVQYSMHATFVIEVDPFVKEKQK